jgi:AcrR family transcriptional regulator
MVATPWGDSEELKDRRLTRGPGAARKDVLENQRARVFGAVVASVAEVGYERSGVDQVAKISGVSSRTVYNLFAGGKEEYFGIVLGQIVDATLTALSAAGEEEEEWERRLAAIYGRFAQMVAAQPAAASVVLTDAYAAGPAATRLLERATRAFEELSRRRLDESPGRTGLPTAMVEAQVGAMQELARTRIRRGEPDAMLALVPELVDLVAGYQPPPERLRLGNRRPTLETDNISSSEEAERVIRGFTLAAAEHGYAGVTIHEIVRHASMSPNTFYANFPDKRAVLLAAVDSSTAQLQALAMAAYRRSPGWAAGVRAAIGSALGFLAARPATANLLLAEIYAGGPEAIRVRAESLAELVGILEEGAHENPEVPPIAPEAILGGIIALARRQLLRKGAESLPSLAPVATYIALAPYIGADEACTAANGDGRPGPATGEKPRFPRVSMKGSKWVINAFLGDRWATAETIAEELGTPVESVAGQLSELEADGLAEKIRPPDSNEQPEWTNTKKFRLIDGEDWAAMTAGERKRLTEDATRMTIAELAEAVRRGSLGRRLDEHHTRLILELDEEGWDELVEIHRAAFNASQAVRVKSEARLRASGGRVIEGRSVQLLFELPDDD